MVATFILGIALTAFPIQAHTTLGRPTGDMPYRTWDTEESPNHVPGLIGYVWPGSGKDWYIGDIATGPGDYTEPPGYQSPWPSYPPGPPLPTWWQLKSNAYAPFGAILTSTDDFLNKGDMIFAITFWTKDLDPSLLPADGIAYSKLDIYIPPEFTPPVDWEGGDASNIVVSTPFAVSISVKRVDVKDAIAPNWWCITIEEDNDKDVAFAFGVDGDYDEWYYIRVNGMAAPKIAGRYFFKMLINGVLPSDVLADACGVPRFYLSNAIDETGAIRPQLLIDTYPAPAGGNNVIDLFDFFPVENWPCLLVKGEVDPGIIEGRVYYGTWSEDLRGTPLMLPGVVRAVGVTPEGRHVEARGYFNDSAKGHFEIEGVAPGTYTIYASAAGYPEQKVAEGVIVYAGKSAHLDIYLEPGAVVWGKIFSKHGPADIPWYSHHWQWLEWEEKELGPFALSAEQTNIGGSWYGLKDEFIIRDENGNPIGSVIGEDGELYVSPIMVEIYDSNDWPAPKPGYVWGDVNTGVLDESYLFERGTPTDLVWTDEGYKPATKGHLLSFSPINYWDEPYTSYGRNTPLTPSAVAFPWESNPYDEDGDGFAENIFNGVGPSTVWWTKAGTKVFEFKFGDKDLAENRIYGAPTEFDGHIPQLFATWIDGLKPGVYYLRVWTSSYVQTDVNGNYVDYMFEVASEEWAGDIYVPIDLQLSGKIVKLVHFHDLPGTLKDQPINGPDEYRWLIAEARDEEGNLVALNFRPVFWWQSFAYIPLWGFGWEGPGFASPFWYFMYGYRHIRDYGIMPGTYKVYVYMRGYVQQEFEWASVSLTGKPSIISNHMYRGAGINVTVYSIDWQHPRIDRPWIFPGKDVKVTVIGESVITKGNKGEEIDLSGEEFGTIKVWDGSGWVTPATPDPVDEITTVPYPGWPYYSYMKFNGSTACEEDGPSDFLADPEGYYQFGADKDWKTKLGLETGSYKFDVSVKGYVFKDADKYIVYAAKGHQADTKLNVVIGANITATIIFKKESVIECTPFHMDMEVELYDKDGNFIGTGEIIGYVLCNGKYMTWDDFWNDLGIVGIVGTWVPADVKQVVVQFYGVDAYPNYDGEWWIEVDTWTKYGAWWYWLPDYSDFDGWLYWYPPVEGLLMGKDYHLIGGDSGYQGDACAFNHLGPYEQRAKVRVPNTHLSGEASVIFELDRRGYLSGQIYGFTWSEEMRPISWAKVIAVGESGEFTLYSVDGFYEGFLPSGAYTLTVVAYEGDIGYNSVTASVNVPDGGAASYSFEGLSLSHIPIPEFPVAAIALISALAASLYILRRIKK
jgi:hypothetical protein